MTGEKKPRLVDLIGQFTTFPNSVIELWPQLGGDAMLMFLYFRYRTNSESGECWPSFDTIQRDTGMRRERITKAIRVLLNADLLEKRRRFSNSTVYALKCPLVHPPDYWEEARATCTKQRSISPTGGLPLVRQGDTNQTHVNQTHMNKNDSPRFGSPEWLEAGRALERRNKQSGI